MKAIKNEAVYFLTALMFFTRIPVPFKVPYSKEIMNRSQRYFSWVGLLVGILNAGVLFVSYHLFNADIAIVMMIIFSVLLTGAFHEDGFADVCDSFGGGYNKTAILTIMKDSRIGAYGTIGMVLIILLKFFSIEYLLDHSITKTLYIIIIAHAYSRFMAGTMIYTHQYVTDIDSSKSKPLANDPDSTLSLIIGAASFIIPIFLIQDWKIIPVLLFSLCGKLYLGWYFKKHIGGFTGDCLGTVQQVCEILFYLGTIMIWKFI